MTARGAELRLHAVLPDEGDDLIHVVDLFELRFRHVHAEGVLDREDDVDGRDRVHAEILPE